MANHAGWAEGMPNTVYFFGDFRLDPARRELIKGADLIDLPSSSFDCLVYLIQHRERAVGRDELISAVWGRADISDNLLSQTLVRVRRALGEAASDRSSIRTVTKFGYRWIAATRSVVEQPPPPPVPAPGFALATESGDSGDSTPTLGLDSAAPSQGHAAGRTTLPPVTRTAVPTAAPGTNRDAAASSTISTPPSSDSLATQPAASPDLGTLAASHSPIGAAETRVSVNPPANPRVTPAPSHAPPNIRESVPPRASHSVDPPPVVGARPMEHAHAGARSAPAQKAARAGTSQPPPPLHHPPSSQHRTSSQPPTTHAAPPHAGPEANNDPTAQPNERHGNPPARLRTRRRLRWMMVVVCAASVPVVALLSRRSSEPARDASGISAHRWNADNPAAPALVLPVAIDAPAGWEWLRVGLMDLISARLRDGGMPVWESRSVYRWLGALSDGAAARANVDVDVSAQAARRLHVTASLRHRQWTVHIVGAGDGRRIEAIGQASDPGTAARLAADNVLLSLGHAPPDVDTAPTTLQALLERSESALRANRLAYARALIERAPATLRDDASVQVVRAEIDVRSGRPQAARERLEPLLHAPAEPGAERLRLKMLNTLAAALVLGPQPRAADPLLEEAARIGTRIERTADQARTLELRAARDSALGDPEQALLQLAAARTVYDAAGDPLGVAQTNRSAGNLCAALGRYAEADAYLTRAADTFEAFGLSDRLALARADLGALRLALLDAAGALALSDAYWPPEAQSDDEPTRHHLTLERAAALAARGRLAEAETLYTRVLGANERSDHEAREAALGSATIALHRGAYTRVLQLAAPIAHADAADDGRAVQRYTAWHLLIEALRRSGDAAGARAETRQFTSWVESLDTTAAALSASARRDARFYAALDRAADEMSDNAPDAAMRALADLLAQARDGQMPLRQVQVAAVYVPKLLATGRTDDARAVAGSLALWAGGDVDAAWVLAQVHRASGDVAMYRELLARMRELAGERPLPDADGTPPASG